MLIAVYLLLRVSLCVVSDGLCVSVVRGQEDGLGGGDKVKDEEITKVRFVL